jgi:TonB-linked SusC/RagA family outer membrane protein
LLLIFSNFKQNFLFITPTIFMKKQLRNKKWLWGALLGLLLSNFVWAQDRQVTGRVTAEEDGSALPGASVVIRGTTRGTTTNLNGEFKLMVKPGDLLVVSSVGFAKKEIRIGTQTTIDAKLSPNLLDEVVVTALGQTADKKSLTSAVSRVDGTDLSETGRNNFMDALASRVPGLSGVTTSGNPGASSSISLRGFSSIGSNNQPLFVVDGLPVDNNTFGQGALGTDAPNRNNDYANRISDLNPNDIDNISILKGPEAAALYGIDAANGAVVITTRKGRAGQVRISYDNNFRFETVNRFPEVQRVYGRGAFGLTSPTATQYFGPKYAEGTQFFDNIGNFFQQGRSAVHNLGIEGGSDRATYRLSMRYTNWRGLVPTTGEENLSVKLNNVYKIGKKMELTSSLNYIWRDINKAFRGNNGFLTGLVNWRPDDDASNFLNLDGTRRLLLPNGLVGELDNPFFSVNKNLNTESTNRTIGNFNYKYNVLDWLTLEARFGADIYTTKGNQFTHPESNIIINSATGAGGGATSGGALEQYVETSRLLNANFLATLQKKIDKLSIKWLLGTSVDDRRYEVNSYYGERFYDPGFNSIANTDVTTQRARYFVQQRRLLAAFSSVTFDYDGYLYLTITGRNDWTSTLPLQSRSFFYPSVGLSYAFTEMPSLKGNTGPLSFGKLRFSYAEVGKDAAPYRVQSALQAQLSTGGGFIYGVFGGNPDLRPERTKSWEVGADLKFFDGRLGLDIAYYNKTSADQIVTQRLSYGTGFILALLNGGTFSNSGVEVQLTGKPIKRKDFSWDVTLNFTKIQTSVNNLPADQPEYYNSDTWLYNNARSSAFVSDLARFYPQFNLSANQRGMGSATAIGGYSYLRNNNGDVLISPATGLPIVNQNFLPIGDRNPDFTLGISNKFTYKKISLSFLLDLRKGGDVFNGTAMYLWRQGLHPRSVNRETPVTFRGVLRDGLENTTTPTPNNIQITPNRRTDVYYNAFAEEDFVERDINWLRLRDVSLNYSIPIKKKNVIKSASISLRGTDLFLLTNYTGADPNVNGTTASSGGVGAGGFDFMTVSLPRAFAVGITLGL